MRTNTKSPSNLVARVAVNVRLYFDVEVGSDDETAIKKLARNELKRVAHEEWLLINELSNPAIYPKEDWPGMKLTDFDVCDVSSADRLK